MNYQETLEYFSALPPFIPRKTAPGEDLFNLDSIRALLARLGNPERRLRFVHIAGTNGKGSTCAFLQQILTSGGCRTGRFTSPALVRPTEQITVDAHEIDRESFAALATRIRSASEEMARRGESSPSGFEMLTALAFLYFLQEKCGLVVLETGLGGRLDATNVIPAPLLAVITQVSLEHTEVLGDTLAEIAREKAGIFKSGSEALLYPQEAEAAAVFAERARALCIPLHHAALPENIASFDLAGQTFTLQGTAFCTRLLAPCQAKNAALAVQAARLLCRHGFALTEDVIAKGLLLASWPGRFELLRQNPCVIVDGSHNPAGALSLREGLLQYFPQKKIHFIAGVLADKRFEQVMEPLLPLAECFYTIKPASPRALEAERLAAYLRSRGCAARSCTSPEDALKKALDTASENDVICAFGSLYSVGQIRAFFGTAPSASSGTAAFGTAPSASSGTAASSAASGAVFSPSLPPASTPPRSGC